MHGARGMLDAAKWDGSVPCYTGTAKDGTTWDNCNPTGTGAPTPMFTSTYRVNGLKGWYDAGDHGKYVVNGGIAVWTMLNQYEQHLYWERLDALYWFRDGALKHSRESRPITASLISSTRRVGRSISCSVCRCRTGAAATLYRPAVCRHPGWCITCCTTRPGPTFPTARMRCLTTVTGYTRAAYPPSRAATLNLAAVGAQCARIWRISERQDDKDFATKCLNAATAAWDAAQWYTVNAARPLQWWWAVR